MNSLQVIFALGLIVIVSSLPIEFTQGNGDLKLTINDIFSEINDVLKRDLNEQLNKDAIDFGDKVNTTTHDGGKLQVQVQHFNAANGFPVFFKPNDQEILDDKKVSQVVEKVDEHATETSTSVTFSTSKSSSAPVYDVSKATESVSTTSAVPSTTKLASASETVSTTAASTTSVPTTSASTTKVSEATKPTESASTTTTTHSASSLESVSTSSVAPIITIVLPVKVSEDSNTKAPIKTRSLEQSVSTTSAIPTTTRLSSSVAGASSTTSAAPATTTTLSSSSVAGAISTSSAAPAITTTSQAKVSEVSTESVSTTTAAPSTTTTHAPTTTTSGNIFLEAFDSFASLFQSKPDPVPTTTHAPTTTTLSGLVSTSTKQSDVAEVPTSSNSPITQIVELKKDIAAVPVIFTQV